MTKNNSNLLIILGLVYSLFTGWLAFAFLNAFPSYRENIMTNNIMQVVYFLGLYIFMAFISYILFLLFRTVSLIFVRYLSNKKAKKIYN